MRARLVRFWSLFWQFLRKLHVLLCWWSGLFYFTVHMSCCVSERHEKEIFHCSPLGEVGDHWNSSRPRKGVQNRCGNQSLLLHFRITEDIRKIIYYNDKLMWCLVGFQLHLHGQYLSQGKKSSFWKTSSVSKEVVHICLHLHRIATVYSNNQVNELQLPCHWNQGKHWAKWQWLGAKCSHLHSKIFQPEM